MDGNGRWATRGGLARTFGHVAASRRSAGSSRRARAGRRTLTLYAFSCDNWRPAGSRGRGADGAAARTISARDRERCVASGVRLTSSAAATACGPRHRRHRNAPSGDRRGGRQAASPHRRRLLGTRRDPRGRGAGPPNRSATSPASASSELMHRRPSAARRRPRDPHRRREEVVRLPAVGERLRRA